jgi:Homeodomain-like domain
LAEPRPASDPPPLTADQRRAAAMVAAGTGVKETAGELGVNPRTVTRWSQRDDFRDLARHHRESLLPDVPTAEGVLVCALSAVTAAGRPDWTARIAAARALLGAPVASDAAQTAAERVERIYVSPEGGEGEP